MAIFCETCAKYGTPVISPLSTYHAHARDFGQRSDKTQYQGVIDTITIHCYCSQCTAKDGVDALVDPKNEDGTNRTVSCNYVVGKDGSIACSVPENLRSICTCSGANDCRAITIEVASDEPEPCAVTDAAYNALIKLVADVCRRNSIKRLVWSTDKYERMQHINGCNMTVHRDYWPDKTCPGEYLYSRHGEIASLVNELLAPLVTDFRIKDVQATAVTAYFVTNDFSINANNSWRYKVFLKDELVMTERLRVNTEKVHFTINNLLPNTAYSIEIETKDEYGNTSASTRLAFMTLRDRPRCVKNLMLKTSQEQANKIVFTVDFTPPESWGECVHLQKEQGYRASLLKNGIVISEIDNLVEYGQQQLKVTNADFGVPVSELVEASIQVGIQAWIKDIHGETILDSDSPTGSNAVYVQTQARRINKVFLFDRKIKGHRVILYNLSKDFKKERY